MTRAATRTLYGEPLPDGSKPFWRTPTLWAAAAGKPACEILVAKLAILDCVVWFGGLNNRQPTIRNVANHAHDIVHADMSYPIIMTRSGDILDGAHRIARAYLDGKASIMAVVLDNWPPPDGFATPAGSR